MDDALEKVVDGTWNLEEAAHDYAVAVAATAKVDKYGKLFAKGDYEMAYQLGHELVKGPLAKNANQLNTMAWQIVDPEKKPTTQDLELALTAATLANKLTDNKNAAFLDTLAHVHRDRGDIGEAVKVQTMAVKFAEGAMKGQLEKALEEFKKDAAVVPASGKKDAKAVEGDKVKKTEKIK
jgi:hypothetical protein